MSKTTYLPYDPDQQLLPASGPTGVAAGAQRAYHSSPRGGPLPAGPLGHHGPLRILEERRGGPPYHPRPMVKVLLYGYCTGVASSRRIAPASSTRTWLPGAGANNTSRRFRTVSDFRKDHLQALGGRFLQVLALCQQAGLVKLAMWPWTGPRCGPTPPGIRR